MAAKNFTESERTFGNSLNLAYKLHREVIQEAGCIERLLVCILSFGGNEGVLGIIPASVDSYNAHWGDIFPHGAQSRPGSFLAGRLQQGCLLGGYETAEWPPVHNVERGSNFCFLLRLTCVYFQLGMVRILMSCRKLHHMPLD